MTTVKVKFRPSTVEDKEGSLFYQVIHGRVSRQISSGHKIWPDEWDSAAGSPAVPEGDGPRARHLREIIAGVNADVRRLRHIVSRFEQQSETYTADMIVNRYSGDADSSCFFSFANSVISRLGHLGHHRISEIYAATVNRFAKFCSDGTIPLADIDSELMLEYEAFLRAEGICRNTSSFYMRNMRALYNRAVEQGLVEQCHPFRHVYTGISKTVKRAIPLKTLRQIKQLDLTSSPHLEFARDMFLFSFFMRGMSFVDMAYLKKSDLQGGVLVYRRKKTRQQLIVKWEVPMQDIVRKYARSGSPYMLPIIKRDDGTDRTQYRTMAHLINERLKQIGQRLSLPIPLTMYVARHAWASIAHSKNVAVSVISEAMGHDSEKTTRIYLASLDTSTVDKANSMIIKSL